MKFDMRTGFTDGAADQCAAMNNTLRSDGERLENAQ